MANTKQQEKRNLQNEAHRVRNVAVRSRMKTYMKRALAAVESGDKAAMDKAVTEAVAVIDRAVAKGVIHANSAARKKSSIMTRAAAR